MTGLTRPSRELAGVLRPGDVRQYLTSRGWIGEPYGPGGKGLLFHHPATPQVDLLLPLNHDLGDYAKRMQDLVASLAAIEERPMEQVLEDLSASPADVIRLRVVADAASLGSLPLDEGIRLLRGGRDLLIAASCSEIHPHPFHTTNLPIDVRRFLKTCRLGQTERGSFIATILAPVPPDPPLIQATNPFESEDIEPVAEPFPRRVTTRLMTGLDHVSGAVVAGVPGRILDGIDRGVSANLCEALAEMKPPGEQSHLDISISWSASRGRIPKGVPRSVSFPQESFSTIGEVGRQLRMRALARPQEYRGRLLSAEFVNRHFQSDLVGRIIFNAVVTGQPARIKADLLPDDFRLACEALPERRDIAVTGTIRHEVKAREYELHDVKGFRVIEGTLGE